MRRHAHDVEQGPRITDEMRVLLGSTTRARVATPRPQRLVAGLGQRPRSFETMRSTVIIGPAPTLAKVSSTPAT